MSELERLRRPLEVPTPLLATASTLMGGAYAALSMEYFLLTAVLGVIGCGIIFLCNPNMIAHAHTNFRDPLNIESMNSLAYFIPPAVVLLATPLSQSLVQDIAASEVTQGLSLLGVGTLAALSTAFSFRRHERIHFKEGKLQSIKALSKGIKGASVERLEIAREHREVLVSLMALGAVVNVEASAGIVAKMIESSVEEVIDSARALAHAGLVGIGPFVDGGKAYNTQLWVTEIGVRVVAEAAKR